MGGYPTPTGPVRKVKRKRRVSEIPPVEARLSELNEAVLHLESYIADHTAAVTGIEKDSMVDQETLQTAYLLKRLKPLIKAADDLFDAKMKEHKPDAFHKPNARAGLPGLIIALVKKAGRRSPKWKDEAITNAEKVAAALGEPFDAEEYAKAVLEATPEGSPSVSVNLTEVY